MCKTELVILFRDQKRVDQFSRFLCIWIRIWNRIVDIITVSAYISPTTHRILASCQYNRAWTMVPTQTLCCLLNISKSQNHTELFVT